MRPYRIHDKIDGWVDLGECFATWESIPFLYFSFADYSMLPDAEERDKYIECFHKRRFRVFGPRRKRRQAKFCIKVDRVALEENIEEFLRLESEGKISRKTTKYPGYPHPGWYWPSKLNCFQIIFIPRKRSAEVSPTPVQSDNPPFSI